MTDHGQDYSRRENIGLGAALNAVFTTVEIIGGVWTNSFAILADALHDLGDTVTLLVAWIAEHKAEQDPDVKRTFGYQRVSLLSAVFSAVILVAGSAFILWRAVPRLLNPEPVHSTGMMGLALLGVVFNGMGALKLRKGESMSEEVLAWHFWEDVLGWSAIFVGAVAIHLWEVYVLDPVLTIGFTVFILYNVARNLREIGNILLQGVPRHIDVAAVENELAAVDGVKRVHDIHIWSLEGETDIFTGHVVVTPALLEDPDATRRRLKDVLAKHHIEHSTIELETEQFCSGIECGNGYEPGGVEEE